MYSNTPTVQARFLQDLEKLSLILRMQAETNKRLREAVIAGRFFAVLFAIHQGADVNANPAKDRRLAEMEGKQCIQKDFYITGQAEPYASIVCSKQRVTPLVLALMGNATKSTLELLLQCGAGSNDMAATGDSTERLFFKRKYRAMEEEEKSGSILDLAQCLLETAQAAMRFSGVSSDDRSAAVSSLVAPAMSQESAQMVDHYNKQLQSLKEYFTPFRSAASVGGNVLTLEEKIPASVLSALWREQGVLPPPLPEVVKAAYMASQTAATGFFSPLINSFSSKPVLPLNKPFKFAGTSPLFCLIDTPPVQGQIEFAREAISGILVSMVYCPGVPYPAHVLLQSGWQNMVMQPRVIPPSERSFDYISSDYFPFQTALSKQDYGQVASIAQRNRTSSFSFMERYVSYPIGANQITPLTPPEKAVIEGDLLALDYFLANRIPARACVMLIPLALLFNQDDILEYLLLRREIDPTLGLAINKPFPLVLNLQKPESSRLEYSLQEWPSKRPPTPEKLANYLQEIQNRTAFEINRIMFQQGAVSFEKASARKRLLQAASEICDDGMKISSAAAEYLYDDVKLFSQNDVDESPPSAAQAVEHMKQQYPSSAPASVSAKAEEAKEP